MSRVESDITVRVRFLTPAEGGRSTPVEGSVYGCPFFVDEEGFDCRLILNGVRIELGEFYDLRAKFLYRELVLPKISIGKEFYLWEGRKVAEGKVVQVGE